MYSVKAPSAMCWPLSGGGGGSHASGTVGSQPQSGSIGVQVGWHSRSARSAPGARAAAALDQARARVARALAVRPEHVVFTAGGTEANNLGVLGALSRGALRRGARPQSRGGPRWAVGAGGPVRMSTGRDGSSLGHVPPPRAPAPAPLYTKPDQGGAGQHPPERTG